VKKIKYHIIIPFLLPALLLYLVFVIYPYARAIYISLTKWRGLTPNPEFIGLGNFERLLGDNLFWNALGNNAVYLIFIPIITLSISLYLAFLVTHGQARFSRFYRITFFFPQVMSLVAIGVLWSFIYHPTIGILSSIAEALGGGKAIAWLGDPNLALPAVGAVVVWQAIGFYMVLFIAGMESIPVSYYEAATIDGATRWDLFWRVTLPLLWDTIRTATVFLAIAATNMFAITQTMTQGGPNRATDVLATYVYDQAFRQGNFGYATAVAVAMFVIAFALSLLTMRATQRESLEY
jgi:N-acetylglucosamine transport system permease protein